MPEKSRTERLLERLAGSERAQSMLGDLQEYRSRSRRGRVRNALWQAAVLTGISARYLKRFIVLWPERAGKRRRPLLDTLQQNLSYSVRWLRRSPGFAATAVLTLSIGLGVNTGIFSVIQAILLQPLPYRASADLVMLSSTRRQEELSVAYPDLEDWRKQTRVFEKLAGFAGASKNLTGAGEAERLRGAAAQPEVFTVLQAGALHGRVLQLHDEVEAARVVVIGYDLWQRRFAGDQSIVGRTIELDRQPYTVVGIMPPGFRFPDGLVYGAAEFWTPLSTQVGASVNDRDEHPGIVGIGRLRSGRTLEDARAELTLIAQRLAQAYPATNRESGVMARSALDSLVGDVRPVLSLIFGAAGLILLIACSNVSGLLLTRSASRQRELAVRAALGATRKTLLGQLLTESLVLSAVSALAGLGLACVITRLVPVLAGDLPRLEQVGINRNALLFMSLIAIGNTLIFGSASALHTASRKPDRWLRQRSLGGRGQHLRSAAAGAQIALSLVLLAGAAVLLESLEHVLERERGLQPEQVLTFSVQVPPSDYAEGEPVATFYRSLHERLATLPGVEAAGAISTLPFSGAGSQSGINPVGGTTEQAVRTDVNAVTPDYFRTMGVQLRRGRLFTDADRAGAPIVGIVDESFARRVWPDRDPIGQRVQGWGFSSIEIVGVVAHVKNYGVIAESREELYLPHAQRAYFRMNVVLRTMGDPEQLITAARRVLAEMDGNIPLHNAQRMTAVINATIATPRLAAFLSSTFAALALALALIGVYGVVAFAVAQRTGEFGVRAALGASTTDLLRAGLKPALTMSAAGILAGVLGALILAHFLEGVVFGVSARDATAFVAAAGIMLLTVLAAALVPALRAARVQPLVALRSD